MNKTKSHRRLFITRRFILPPTPASDILVPTLTALLAVILGTIALVILPAPSFYDSGKDYQSISYEYFPPQNNLLSIVVHSEKSVNGQLTQASSAWTFKQGSKTPYNLNQIFRDHAFLDTLANKSQTSETLKESSFAIDRENQELITSLDGLEQRTKFSDLEGRLSYEFSEPMFGLNPFTYKNPDSIDCKISKCLALTFDDGPGVHTDRLLDILKYSHAKATFFVLGHRVSAFSGQIARIANEGHDLGNHSWIHRNLPKFSYTFVLDDLRGTTNVIQHTSTQRIKFLRPPYGNINSTVRNAAATLNQQIVLWSIDPQDWLYKNATQVCNHVVSRARPGSIILLHDIHPTSVDAAQCIINRLSEQYTFVNLTTLYK